MAFTFRHRLCFSPKIVLLRQTLSRFRQLSPFFKSFHRCSMRTNADWTFNLRVAWHPGLSRQRNSDICPWSDTPSLLTWDRPQKNQCFVLPIYFQIRKNILQKRYFKLILKCCVIAWIKIETILRQCNNIVLGGLAKLDELVFRMPGNFLILIFNFSICSWIQFQFYDYLFQGSMV
jgi:hypothetical protein